MPLNVTPEFTARQEILRRWDGNFANHICDECFVQVSPTSTFSFYFFFFIL